MVFHWSLNDRKSLQVSRTLLSILNNAVVSSDLQLFQLPYQTFGNRSECTNYNWYHRHLRVPHIFLSSLARSNYLSLFSFSLIFTLWSVETAKSTIRHVVFFLTIIRSGILNEISWSIRISKSQSIIIFFIWEFFHISVSWWFSTRVWVTASLIKSPGLCLVF